MITKEKKKEYARRYYLKRKEYIKKKSLEYYNSHKNNIEFLEKRQKSGLNFYYNNREKYKIYRIKWQKLNPHKLYKYNLLSKQKFPEKYKARYYAYNHNQIKNKCEKCNSYFKLNFHHTNYELNKGVTLCQDCHYKIHNKTFILIGGFSS